MAHNQQYYRSPFGDTTYTKVFVGGLAWETPTDVMHSYFEQFGEILEAVIITDKNTGKSKGYGFVTFLDPESANKACENPNPVIDGRRANCNIASHGRPRRPSPPRGRAQGGNDNYQGGGIEQGASSSYSGVAAAVLATPPPPTASVIYPPYGYATYPPDYYHQNMYNQQFQQAQYYQQLYGYSMQGTMSATQRFQGPSSYLYYPTNQIAEAAASFSTFRPTRLTFCSPIDQSQTPQKSSRETTEVGAVPSETPNT